MKKVQKNHRIEWVKVDQLEILPQAQRPFKEAWATKLAKEFDPDQLGILIVARRSVAGRPDRYFLIDGQHRAAAVRMALGEGQCVRCEVLEGLSDAEIAHAFLLHNKQLPVRVLDKFVTAVRAGHPVETAIHRIITDLGLHVNPTSPGDGNVRAVAALLRIWNEDAQNVSHAAETVRRTLTITQSAWGKQSDAYHGELLRGIGMLLGRNGDDVDDAALIRKLTAVPGGPMGVIGRGRSLRESLGGTTAKGVAQYLVTLCNKSRRARRLQGFYTDQI